MKTKSRRRVVAALVCALPFGAGSIVHADSVPGPPIEVRVGGPGASPDMVPSFEPGPAFRWTTSHEHHIRFTSGSNDEIFVAEHDLPMLRAAGFAFTIIGGRDRAVLRPDPAHTLAVDEPSTAHAPAPTAQPDPIAAAAPGGGACSGEIALGLEGAPLIIQDLGFRWVGLRWEIAPPEAWTTSFEYSVFIDDTGNPSNFYAGDYEIYLSSAAHGGPMPYRLVYDNCGNATDGGCDDDPENDSDIDLDLRTSDAFNGESPNQWWYVWVQDTFSGDIGQIEEVTFTIDWAVQCVPPVCGLGAGDCFGPNGTPGCNDETCCAAICAADPFCCDTAWDTLCAEQAQEMCAPASCDNDLSGNGDIDFADILIIIITWGPCGVCEEDLDGSGAVDFADIIEVIVSFGPCPSATPGACCNPFDGMCFLFTESECQSQGGVFAGADTTCADTDFDRIPDVFELGDCVQSPCFSGTEPLAADTDGDGIDDGDEVYGTTAGLDLPAMGLDPCRKDILVETDWVHGSGQPANRNQMHFSQVNRAVNMFANAPVPNPDGSLGITLHIDYGQIPYNGGNAIMDSDTLSRVDVDNQFSSGEFFAMKAVNFDANRHGYFHYCLMSDSYSRNGTYVNSSGLAELPGDDLIVSMGQWATGDSDSIGNTFVHELGHNLDLRHGGFENRNQKPNYNSVMNYRYQFCGIDADDDALPDGVLDYSRDLYINLNESNLVESQGVTGTGPGIDWNGDGDAFDTITRNINCRLTNTFSNSICGVHLEQNQPCGTQGACADGACNTLEDNDDWAQIELDHLDEEDSIGEVIFCDLGGALRVLRAVDEDTRKDARPRP